MDFSKYASGSPKYMILSRENGVCRSLKKVFRTYKPTFSPPSGGLFLYYNNRI
jgi:hypothetical protein